MTQGQQSKDILGFNSYVASSAAKANRLEQPCSSLFNTVNANLMLSFEPGIRHLAMTTCTVK